MSAAICASLDILSMWVVYDVKLCVVLERFCLPSTSTCPFLLGMKWSDAESCLCPNTFGICPFDMFILWRRALVAGRSWTILHHVAICSTVICVVCKLCRIFFQSLVGCMHIMRIYVFLCPALCNGISCYISVSCMPSQFLCLFVSGCRQRLLRIGVYSSVFVGVRLCMVGWHFPPSFSSVPSRFGSWYFWIVVVLYPME
jgi:hypothetical protein